MKDRVHHKTYTQRKVIRESARQPALLVMNVERAPEVIHKETYKSLRKKEPDKIIRKVRGFAHRKTPLRYF